MSEEVRKTTLELAIDARNARTGAAEFKQGVDTAKNAATEADAKTAKLNNRMNLLGRTLGSLKGMLGGLALSMSVAFGGAQAIHHIVSYQDAMAQLQGVTGATAAQMKQMQSTSRALGATTKFSATEAGEGMLFLARAGFAVDETLNALPATLDLATAGVLDLGNAADIASNLVKQFGLDTKDTARVGDVLVNVANSSNTSVQQLADAMKFVGPVAHTLGISLEETAAAIGVLGDAGLQGMFAGTNLRAALAQLIAPTDAAKKRFAEMGITAADVNPQVHSLADIFELLKNRGLDAESALEIFTRRAGPGTLVLRDATGRLRELQKATEAAGGTAARNARIFETTLGQSFRNLSAAIVEGFLRINDTVAGRVFKTMVDGITDVIRALFGMEDKIVTNRTAVIALANAVRILVAAFAALVVMNIPAVLSAIQVGVVKLSGALKLLALSNPWVLIAVGIAGVVAALWTFRDAQVTVFGFTTSAAEVVIGIWERIKSVAASVWASVGTAVLHGVNLVWGILKAYTLLWWNLFKVGFGAIWTVVKETFTAIWDIIQSIGQVILGSSLFQAIASVFITAFSDMRKHVVLALIGIEFALERWSDFLAIALLGVQLKFSRWKDSLVKLFFNDLPAILNFFARNWEAVFIDIGNIVFTAMKNIGHIIAVAAKGFAEMLVGNISSDQLKDRISKSIGNGILDGYKSSISSTELQALREKLNQPVVASKNTQALAGAKERLTNDLEDQWVFFKNKRLNELRDVVAKPLFEAKKTVVDEVASPKTKGPQLTVPDLGSGLGGAAGAAPSFGPAESVDVGGQFTGLAQQFTSAYQRTLDNTATNTAKTAQSTEKTASYMEKIWQARMQEKGWVTPKPVNI